MVAGASGTRSEFNGDFAWSDYVVQKGYAYASQNKGVLNLRIASLASATPPNDARLPAQSRLEDLGQLLRQRPGSALRPLARSSWARPPDWRGAGVEARYGRAPRFTYAVGTSNGGYQVRRAVELFPDLFDGGVDWEGTEVDRARSEPADRPAARDPQLHRTTRPPASTRTARRRRTSAAAGYPPDLVAATTSRCGPLLGASSGRSPSASGRSASTRPTTLTVRGPGTYNYYARLSAVGRRRAGGELRDHRATSSAR